MSEIVQNYDKLQKKMENVVDICRQLERIFQFAGTTVV
jgi:hypothetical protein